MPAHTTLHGIDALVRHGRDLIGVQNGIDPQRVVRVRMNAGWTAIEGMDVLAANLPEMDEPTLATLAGERSPRHRQRPMVALRRRRHRSKATSRSRRHALCASSLPPRAP